MVIMYIQSLDHKDGEHMCPALVHECSQVGISLVSSGQNPERMRSLVVCKALSHQTVRCTPAPEHVVCPGMCKTNHDESAEFMSDLLPSHIPHEMHKCEVQACPLQCQLCKRTCITEEHLHGLDLNSAHLCG
jgi:hypothetical protein